MKVAGFLERIFYFLGNLFLSLFSCKPGAVHPYKRSQARGSGQAESHRHVMCNTVTLTAYPQTVVAGSNPAVVTDYFIKFCVYICFSPACEGRRVFTGKKIIH